MGRLVGRDDLLAALATGLSAGQSALLTGRRGTGRTAVLEAVADTHGAGALLLSGRECLDDMPFGPWASVLAAYGARLDEPLSVYTDLPRRIAGDLSLLLLDDVDLFDPGSALLAVQLVRLGVPVVASTPTTEALPASLRDPVRRWRRVELTPLRRRDVIAVAEAELGRPLAAPTLGRVVAWSSGLPAVTTRLVGDARDRGRVLDTAAGTRIDDPVVSAAVLDYLGLDSGTAEAHLTTLRLLAVAGGLPATAVDPATVEAMVAAGLVHLGSHGLEPAHPVLAPWALDEVPRDHRRVLAGRAAELVAPSGPDDLRAHLQVCARTEHEPRKVVAAAEWLLSRSRPLEARELLDTIQTPQSVPEPDRWRWAICRARAHRELGEGAEALAALDMAAEVATGDEQLISVVQRWTALLGGWVAEDDALAARIEGVVPRLSDERARGTVAAVLARRRVILGERSGGDSGDLVVDPLVTLLRKAMGGSLEFTRDHFVPPPDDEVDDEDFDELLGVLGRFLGLVYNGDLVEGRQEADRRYEHALEEGRPSLGLWSYNRTKIAFHAGEYSLALTRGREMRRHLAWRDVAGQGLPGEALLAAVLARCGRNEEAAEIVARLGSEELKLPRVLLGANRVRAEAELAAGNRGAAAALLSEAGRFAVENGEAHSGLLALDEAYQVDPAPEHATRLLDHAGLSGIAAVAADRVRAVDSGDAATLEDVAERFLAMPLYGRAVHCLGVAADLHGRDGRAGAERRCRARAAVLAAEHGLGVWPGGTVVPLTAREREIAILAAERVRSREIAERLGLSPRTVDNHLARIFRKLGVTGRDELAEALGPR